MQAIYISDLKELLLLPYKVGTIWTCFSVIMPRDLNSHIHLNSLLNQLSIHYPKSIKLINPLLNLSLSLKVSFSLLYHCYIIDSIVYYVML